MNASNFFVQVVARFISPTPKFFKLLRNALLVLGAVSMLLTYLKDNGVDVPILGTIGEVVVFVSSFIAALIAQLTKEDAPPQPKDNDAPQLPAG